MSCEKNDLLSMITSRHQLVTGLINMNNKRLLMISIAFSVLTACSMSPVQQTSDSQNTALIRSLPGWNPLSVIAVQIYRIDDKKFQKASNHEVTAGEHKVEVRCSRETPEPVQRYYIFDMYLKAGHVYKPKLDMTKDCYVYYVDAATGKKYIGVED